MIKNIEKNHQIITVEEICEKVLTEENSDENIIDLLSSIIIKSDVALENFNNLAKGNKISIEKTMAEIV